MEYSLVQGDGQFRLHIHHYSLIAIHRVWIDSQGVCTGLTLALYIYMTMVLLEGLLAVGGGSVPNTLTGFCESISPIFDRA